MDGLPGQPGPELQTSESEVARLEEKIESERSNSVSRPKMVERNLDDAEGLDGDIHVKKVGDEYKLAVKVGGAWYYAELNRE
jgi:hypothetical protein